jgi:hypothetical protein
MYFFCLGGCLGYYLKNWAFFFKKSGHPGTLTEGEGSVRLTSLYLLVKIVRCLCVRGVVNTNTELKKHAGI